MDTGIPHIVRMSDLSIDYLLFNGYNMYYEYRVNSNKDVLSNIIDICKELVRRLDNQKNITNKEYDDINKFLYTTIN
jgi:hypothetical protein